MNFTWAVGKIRRNKKLKPVWDLNPSWDLCDTGAVEYRCSRALLRYRRGHRFKFRAGLKFFQALFALLLKYCEDRFHIGKLSYEFFRQESMGWFAINNVLTSNAKAGKLRFAGFAEDLFQDGSLRHSWDDLPRRTLCPYYMNKDLADKTSISPFYYVFHDRLFDGQRYVAAWWYNCNSILSS